MACDPPIKIDQKDTKRVYNFAEALVMTGFGKFNLLITLLCGTIALSAILETVGLSFIISGGQCDLELSIADKGIVGAVPLIGLLSTSQIWGYMADTKGRRKILMISMMLGSICSMISSFSPNLGAFIFLKLLSTAIMSAANAVLFAYFGEMMPRTHADMMISVLSSIFVGSAVVATGIAWGVLTLDFRIPLAFLGITYRPWRLLIICFASPFMLASLGMYFAPESPKYLMSQGKNEEVLGILKMIYTMNTGRSASSYLVDDILIDEQDKIGGSDKKKSVLKSVWKQVAPIFKPPLLKSSFITFTLAFGVIGSVNPFYMWLPDLIDRFFVAFNGGHAEGKIFCDLMSVRTDIRMNMASNETIIKSHEVCDDSFNPNAYPLMLLLTTFLTVVNIIVAIFLRWFPKKLILLPLLVMSCISVLLLYFVKNFYVAWFLMLVFQCCGSTGGIVNAYAVELFPTQYRAMAVSFMLMFGRIGGIIGTNIFGWLIEVNCSLNFFLNGILLTLCVLVAILLPKVSKKKKNIEAA